MVILTLLWYPSIQIMKLLVTDPRERLTASEALEHPFIVRKDVSDDDDADNEMLHGLYIYV